MGIKQWPAALRAANVTVREVNGFPGNDRGRPMPLRPAGVFWHHDASPAGPSPGSLGWITNSYNSGSPSAQIWVDRAGCWYFVGSGYASHAGVVRGPLTSANCIGIETDHTIEPMAPALLHSMRRGLAAVCRLEGRRADFVTFHKIEATPRGRKIDPYFGGNANDTSKWDAELARERMIINGLIDGGFGLVTAPPPDLSEAFDAPIILQSNGAPRPHLFVYNSAATLIKDGASTEALRKAGIPVAQVTPADWDNIRALWEVQPVSVKP